MQYLLQEDNWVSVLPVKEYFSGHHGQPRDEIGLESRRMTGDPEPIGEELTGSINGSLTLPSVIDGCKPR